MPVRSAEAAAAFDELTRSRRDRDLVQQGKFDWPNTFRTARFIPAVDYVNANRHRSLAVRRWEALFSGPNAVDVIVTPTFAASLNQLVATNLTGHPAVVVPHGFRDDGTPVADTLGPQPSQCSEETGTALAVREQRVRLRGQETD